MKITFFFESVTQSKTNALTNGENLVVAYGHTFEDMVNNMTENKFRRIARTKKLKKDGAHYFGFSFINESGKQEYAFAVIDSAKRFAEVTYVVRRVSRTVECRLKPLRKHGQFSIDTDVSLRKLARDEKSEAKTEFDSENATLEAALARIAELEAAVAKKDAVIEQQNAELEFYKELNTDPLKRVATSLEMYSKFVDIEGIFDETPASTELDELEKEFFGETIENTEWKSEARKEVKEMVLNAANVLKVAFNSIESSKTSETVNKEIDAAVNLINAKEAA